MLFLISFFFNAIIIEFYSCSSGSTAGSHFTIRINYQLLHTLPLRSFTTLLYSIWQHPSQQHFYDFFFCTNYYCIFLNPNEIFFFFLSPLTHFSFFSFLFFSFLVSFLVHNRNRSARVRVDTLCTDYTVCSQRLQNSHAHSHAHTHTQPTRFSHRLSTTHGIYMARIKVFHFVRSIFM